MKARSLDRLRCPRCLAEGGREAPFEVDLARDDDAGEVLEAFLVCRACRDVRVVVQGIGVVPLDLRAHLAARGNVYRRAVVADPRLTRFLLSRVGPDGADFVPFEEVARRYGDLATTPAPPDPADAALDATLADAGAAGPALDVGCGVGRATFLLAARCGEAIGCDRSDARLRRARHVQASGEFLLPGPDGVDAPIDLGRLARRDTDFLVATPSTLPFAAGTFSTVVLRGGDGIGAWDDPEAVRRECERVLSPAGTLVEPAGDGWTLTGPRTAVR